MRRITRRLGSLIPARFRDESGSATVETVLWLPVMITLVMLVADVSFIFNNQARALRIVQDANRAFSVGRLNSTTETEDFVRTQLADMTHSSIIATTLTSGVIRTTARIPVSDMTIVSWFDVFSGFYVTVRSEHFLEY